MLTGSMNVMYAMIGGGAYILIGEMKRVILSVSNFEHKSNHHR